MPARRLEMMLMTFPSRDADADTLISLLREVDLTESVSQTSGCPTSSAFSLVGIQEVIQRSAYGKPARPGGNVVFRATLEQKQGNKRRPAGTAVSSERLGKSGFQEFTQLGCRLKLGNRFQCLESGCEGFRQTPECSRPEFLIVRLKVQVVHGTGKMLGSFQPALRRMPRR